MCRDERKVCCYKIDQGKGREEIRTAPNRSLSKTNKNQRRFRSAGFFFLRLRARFCASYFALIYFCNSTSSSSSSSSSSRYWYVRAVRTSTSTRMDSLIYNIKKSVLSFHFFFCSTLFCELRNDTAGVFFLSRLVSPPVPTFERVVDKSVSNYRGASCEQ